MTSPAPEHGDLGVVSASVLSGEAPVRLIRYGTDPEDGWFVLAADDVRPELENLKTMCLHCLIEDFDPEIGVGVEIARAEAEIARAEAEEGGIGGGVGIAVWERGEWLTGDAAS